MAKRRWSRLALLALYAQIVPLLRDGTFRSIRKMIIAELAMADLKSLGVALRFTDKTRRKYNSNSSDRM
jgi:hypothetical protein